MLAQKFILHTAGKAAKIALRNGAVYRMAQVLNIADQSPAKLAVSRYLRSAGAQPGAEVIAVQAIAFDVRTAPLDASGRTPVSSLVTAKAELAVLETSAPFSANADAVTLATALRTILDGYEAFEGTGGIRYRFEKNSELDALSAAGRDLGTASLDNSVVPAANP